MRLPAAIVVVVALLMAGMFLAPPTTSATEGVPATDADRSTDTLRVEALVDGGSQLVLRGGTAQWRHQTKAAPGRHLGADMPTVVNGVTWMPEWPDPGENRDCGGCTSSLFDGLTPPLPAAEQQVILTALDARHEVAIAQQPSAANDFTLIIDFDDVQPSGSAWYVIEIDFSTAIRVEALIDGNSQLVLRDNTAQWRHQSKAAPGRHEGADLPTIINDVEWLPEWPEPGENRDCGGCTSSVFEAVAPPLPATGQPLVLTALDVRHEVGIVQQPSAANDFTLIIDFDDMEPSGSAWYVVEIDLSSTSVSGHVRVVERSYGRLDVIGDNERNEIGICADPAGVITVVVSSDDGRPTIQSFDGVRRDVIVDTKGGDDSILIGDWCGPGGTFPQGVLIETGTGDDVVVVSRVDVLGSLRIAADGGNDHAIVVGSSVDVLFFGGRNDVDHVDLFDTQIARRLTIATGGGFSDVGLAEVTVGGRGWISGGPRSDSISIVGSEFGERTRVDTFDGDDAILIDGVVGSNSLDLRTGAGADRVELTDTGDLGRTLRLGAGDDTLVLQSGLRADERAYGNSGFDTMMTLSDPLPGTTFSFEDIVVVPFVPHASTQRVVVDSGEEMQIRLSPSRGLVMASSAPLSTFSFDYDAGVPQAARSALEEAGRRWAHLVESSESIDVTVEWEAIEDGAGNEILTALAATTTRSASSPSQILPCSLINAIANQDLCDTIYGAGTTDMTIRYNPNLPWDFGLEGSPADGHHDFVTVSMHELAHGLGFTGSFSRVADDGSVLADPQRRTSTVHPDARSEFDTFVVDGRARFALDERVYPNGSGALADLLQSGQVFFGGPRTTTLNEGFPIPLDTPDPWVEGSSLYHLDESIYNGTSHALMTPRLGRSEAHRDPGSIVVCMLADLGWRTARSCDPEPSIETVLDEQGFGDLNEVDRISFPPGTYETEIIAEYSRGHASNAVDLYDVGSGALVPLFEPAEGGFGVVLPEIETLVEAEEFGFSLLRDDGVRLYGDPALNPGGSRAMRVFQQGSSATYLIAFEDFLDGDYQDFVFRLTRSGDAP